MTPEGRSPRVAIVGARGVGRHHANWWHMAGADVCAVAGTSDETNATTRQTLAKLFGFEGRTYTDTAAMLVEEKPDWVDVCSPPLLHVRHVREGLDAGCHVLCEKPFVYDPSRPMDELLRETRELVDLAGSTGRQLALCSQFAVAATWCASRFGTGTPVRRFAGRLVAPARGRPDDSVRVWGDLGPHMLAAAQALMPDGELVRESIRSDFSGGEARTWFEVRGAGGHTMECRLHVNNTDGEPGNVRRLELDDGTFDFDGRRQPDGVFGLHVSISDGREVDREDIMRELIRLTAEGTAPLAGEAVYRNEDWLLQLARAANTSAA